MARYGVNQASRKIAVSSLTSRGVFVPLRRRRDMNASIRANETWMAAVTAETSGTALFCHTFVEVKLFTCC